MKTKVISVRVQSLVSISDKAYKVTCFDGSNAIVPKSQVFGQDYDVEKSNAYWISSWILEQKDLQYSTKKTAWVDEKGLKISNVTIKHHIPKKIKKDEARPDTTELLR